MSFGVSDYIPFIALLKISIYFQEWLFGIDQPALTQLMNKETVDLEETKGEVCGRAYRESELCYNYNLKILLKGLYIWSKFLSCSTLLCCSGKRETE